MAKKYIKYINFTAQEVDASIYAEGDPPIYRLMYSNCPPKEGLTPYNKTLKQKVIEAANGNFDEITLDDGFKSVLKNSRLYFTCPIEKHQGGKHVVFYPNDALKPGMELRLSWDVKCSSCRSILFPEQDCQHPAKVEKKIEKSLQSMSHNESTPSISKIKCDQEKLTNFFDKLGEDLNVILQEGFEKCTDSEDPMKKAEELRNEIMLKMTFAYTDNLHSFKNVQETDGKIPKILSDVVIAKKHQNIEGMSTKAQATYELAKQNAENQKRLEKEEEEDQQRTALIDVHMDAEKSAIKHDRMTNEKNHEHQYELTGVEEINQGEIGCREDLQHINEEGKDLEVEKKEGKDKKVQDAKKAKDKLKSTSTANGQKTRKRNADSKIQNNIMDKYLKK